jgi:starch-binding outer membrane protein, SusD/RagB family
MKIKSIIVTGLMLITAACTDLDEVLYDKVEADNYGKTPAEIATIVGSAYASLRGFSDASSGGTHCYPASEYVFFLTAISSDECVIPTRVGGDWYDGGQYLELQHHTWNTNNKVIWSAWKYCYSGISSVNAVMYQVEQSELADADKVNIYAELRALRAYYYYQLLDLFGNVPIITSFEDTELPANSSRAEVYEFVESELAEVIPLLPETGYGRMTQNAANTLLARLYLNSEVFIGEARWQDCIEACDKVTGHLEQDYFANFKTDNHQSQEIIFAIPYDHKAGTVGNYMASMTFHYEQKYAFSATANYPWCGNGMAAEPGLYKEFDENDIRRNALLIGDQINKATGSIIIMPASGEPLTYTDTITNINEAPQNEGARLFKYEAKDGETWERDHDLVIMRYAEILMMKAECYVRLGTPASAKPLVEEVRARAGLTTPDEIDLELINQELKKEFIFESHRRTDNIRFGDYFNPWWEKEVTPAYRGIFPIPDYEMQKNENLVQNDGY